MQVDDALVEIVLDRNDDSPAAVGVLARTSATRSARVASVSCPTALITGVSQPAIAGRRLLVEAPEILEAALPRPQMMTSTLVGVQLVGPAD